MEKHDFENYPPDEPKDETDINLRCYITRMDDAKVDEYDPGWTNEQVMEWAGDFKSDGTLMLTCSEREVDVVEFREVLEQFIEFRKRLAAGSR